MTATIDDMWGYRLVSENGLNRYLGVSSAYAGVGMDAKLADGIVDLDLGIANELGYNKGVAVPLSVMLPDPKATKDESNRSKYKTFMGRMILTPPGDSPILKSLHLALYAQTNGKNPSSQTLPKSASDNRNLWFEVFPYFKNDKLAIGFEFAQLSNKSTKLIPFSPGLEKLDVKSSYLGGVVTYQVLPKLGCFARLDLYDPNTDNDGSWSEVPGSAPILQNLKTTTVMAGVSHSLATGVRSIVDVEYTKFENPKNASGVALSLDSDVTISARMELKL
jgi:hypothetical protein